MPIETKMKLFYMGRDVESLTKEELIDALKWCVKEIERQRESHKSTLDMWSSFRKAGA